MKNICDEVAGILAGLEVPREKYGDGVVEVQTPITGDVIGRLPSSQAADVDAAVETAQRAFLEWRNVPAPRRGELVRLFGDELRSAKAELGRLVTIEAGKIVSEGLGEVQEMIDICDYAVGLSRQLCGLTIATERPSHRMMETWHPLGVIGVISAFNFPVAVFAWNAALAWVCGNSVVWKPSEKTPLTALAVQALFERACARYGELLPDGLLQVVIGSREVGEALVEQPLVPLVSATGSTAMGRQVAPRLAARFARAILELGGNNGAIVCPSADLELALRGVVFAALGTAGQRCTTLRRLFVHESIYDVFLKRLKKVYTSASVGDPRENGILVGPLIDASAFTEMQSSLAQARSAGAVVQGGERLPIYGEGAFYVRPALVETPGQLAVVKRETFAPILYLMKYREFKEALECPQRRLARPGIFDFYKRFARSGGVPVGPRVRLRDCQCEYRAIGGRDRGRIRRREGNRRRPRIGFRRLEELYAPRDEHYQLRT